MEVWIYPTRSVSCYNKEMVNLLEEQLTANEIRYRMYDGITTMGRPS